MSASMSGPDAFRNHAAECFRLASATIDPEHRLLLHNMAQSWGELAASAEKIQVLLDRGKGTTLH